MAKKSKLNKYTLRVRSVNSLVCVGLDSDIHKIPKRFQKSSHPQFEFNKYIIEETHEFVSAYKLNTAFYEARGAKGIADLQLTMEYLRKNHPSIFTIGDAKRADIGNTNNGYVEFLFDLLGCDTVTLNPYLGKEALQPFLSRADKVSIILCRTSNPGAGELQDLKIGKKPLWQVVAEKVTKDWNKNNNCMLVVGATYPKELKTIRQIVGDMTILIPGIGAQGGDIQKVIRNGMNRQGEGMIINSGRDIIFSTNPSTRTKVLQDEINTYR